MQKKIYEGKPTGLYNLEDFFLFAQHLRGAEFVFAYGTKDPYDRNFAHHITSLGVTLRYERKSNQARVTAFGKKSQISEIEKIIDRQAKKIKF